MLCRISSGVGNLAWDLLHSTAVIVRLRSTRLSRRARCLLVAGILFALAPWPARAKTTSGLDELQGLPAAVAEGADFSSQLLSLARVLR